MATNKYSFKRIGFLIIDFRCVDETKAWKLFEAHMLKCREAIGSNEPPFDSSRYTCELVKG